MSDKWVPLKCYKCGSPEIWCEGCGDQQMVPETRWSKEEQASFIDAAKPLIRWMNENAHPHCKAIVDQISVELMEGMIGSQVTEFQRD